MEIKSVDSVEALDLIAKAADVDELLRENRKEFIKFDISDARHRSRIVTDIADAGFTWGGPLVNFLPKGFKENDDGCPRKTDVAAAVKAFRMAAVDEEPFALFLMGEWCYRRLNVARFIDSVYDISWKLLVRAANGYKRDLCSAAAARELLARLIEDGHYEGGEPLANKLRNSAAQFREAHRRRLAKQKK